MIKTTQLWNEDIEYIPHVNPETGNIDGDGYVVRVTKDGRLFVGDLDYSDPLRLAEFAYLLGKASGEAMKRRNVQPEPLNE